jgi:tetratricopeptide (TPR) repeat protein
MAAHLGKKALLLFWVDEYGGNHSVQVERRFATWLGFVPVGGWWMLALGAGGWWLVRRRVPEADFVAVAALIMWLEFTLIFPVGRYRLPVVVLALVAAAAGIAEALRGAPGPRLGAAVAGTVAVGVAAFVPTWAGFLDHPHASNYGNLATAAVEAGRVRLALEVLEEGLERGEDDMRNLGLHAQILTEAGREEDAAAARKRLEQAAEGTPVQDVRRVFFLARDGKTDEAETLGNRLLGEALAAPLRAELHANLAFTAFRSGDTALAHERLTEARDIAPAHPHVARVSQIIGE